MTSPDGADFSMILETAHAHCNVCSANNAPTVAANATQTVHIHLLGGLAQSHSVLHVWHTNNSTRSFNQLEPLRVDAGGLATLTVEPESIYTVITTTGQSRGSFRTPPPPSAPFPLEWSDDFEAAVVESPPRYLPACLLHRCNLSSFRLPLHASFPEAEAWLTQMARAAAKQLLRHGMA
jgi:hypothetical protein